MIVLDAGVAVKLLVGGLAADQLGTGELAAPHLVDSEVTNALRRLVLRGALTGHQGDIAMAGFTDLRLSRYPADWLRPRMWNLKANLSAYDATYVALAEMLGAPLLTTDRRLAGAPGLECKVLVL